MTAQLPLHDMHVAAGARFAAFAGYEMPMRYSTIKEEHRLVREEVGVFDVSHMGEVFVRGPKAFDTVQRLITNDLGRLADGQALYTLMCREDGGIIDDLIVYRMHEQEYLLCVNAANRHSDFKWIQDNTLEGASATDESDQWVQLAVQGPKAMGVVTTLLPKCAALPPFHIMKGNIAGVPCLIARTGYTGEDGVELYIPEHEAQGVTEALFAAGRPEGIAWIGLGARDSLRLEAKLPLYGNDITLETNPFEAGLAWTVKLDASPFIGSDALRRVKEEGVSRRLRGFVLQGKGMLRPGYGIFVGNSQVGTLTSGSLGISVGERAIGLGYIDIEHANAEEVEIEIRARRVPASVTKKAFYKRNY